MRRFLVGTLCNVATVFVGFLVIGLLTTLFIRSDAVAAEAVGTDGYIFWLNAVTFTLNGVVAAGAGFAHVRLTPRHFLGAVPAVLAAVLLACVVNALLNIPFLGGLGGWGQAAWLLGIVAVGAAAGGTFAARTART